VYDTRGQLLHVEEIPGHHDTVIKREFTPGIYIVRAIASGCAETLTKKIVVSKH
jgi:hypothetical protein